MASIRLAAGDTVMVLSGKYKGKRGKVKLVRRGDGTAEVEGVSVVKRHTKPGVKSKGSSSNIMGSGSTPSAGGIFEKEMPIGLHRLMYVCPKCGKPSKLAFAVKGESKERVCRRCGEPAERPVKA
jgi:large subunit ribosomal protein L24